MTFVVYQITHRTNKRYYIGKTSLKNWERGYMGSGVEIRRAVKKHGPDAFYRTIISTHELEADAYYAEGAIVDYTNPLSYNLMPGGGPRTSGFVGKIMTPETKAKISAALKGRPCPKERKRKISATLKGRPHTAEQNRKIGLAHKNKVVTDEQKKKISDAQKGKKNHFYGKKHSPETIAKLCIINRNRNNPEKQLILI